MTGIATARGSVQGHAAQDFVVHAEAGQALTVSLEAGSPSAYFNLLPPGSSEVAMFIGSTSGSRSQSVAPIAGDYTVRVYLMRSAARRKAASSFTLTALVAGTALVPLPAGQDAVLPGTPFHAAAPVRCTLTYQPDVRECEARVIRYDHAGTATVELRGPRDFVRRILFVKGIPTASDATEPPPQRAAATRSRCSSAPSSATSCPTRSSLAVERRCPRSAARSVLQAASAQSMAMIATIEGGLLAAIALAAAMFVALEIGVAAPGVPRSLPGIGYQRAVLAGVVAIASHACGGDEPPPEDSRE